MIAALRVGRRTLRDAWDALVPVATLNLIWFGLSLTIVLLPPATVALFDAMHELARGRQVDPPEYLRSVRRHFVQAWAWGLLNAMVIALLTLNLWFYDRPEPWAAPVRSLFLLAMLVWLVAQLMTWPYVFEQEEPSLRRALRNALLTVFGAPVFSITIGAVAVVILLMSAALLAPLACITTAILCLLGSHAVRDRLVAFGKRPSPAPPGDEDEWPTSPARPAVRPGSTEAPRP